MRNIKKYISKFLLKFVCILLLRAKFAKFSFCIPNYIKSFTGINDLLESYICLYNKENIFSDFFLN